MLVICLVLIITSYIFQLYLKTVCRVRRHLITKPSAAATRLFIKELFYLDTVDPAPIPSLMLCYFHQEKFPRVNADPGCSPPAIRLSLH